MLTGDLERFIHAFTDCHAWHDDDELSHAVGFIRAQIDVGLTRARLHLDRKSSDLRSSVCFRSLWIGWLEGWQNVLFLKVELVRHTGFLHSQGRVPSIDRTL